MIYQLWDDVRFSIYIYSDIIFRRSNQATQPSNGLIITGTKEVVTQEPPLRYQLRTDDIVNIRLILFAVPQLSMQPMPPPHFL